MPTEFLPCVRLIPLCVAVLASLLLTSCGEKELEVVKPFRPQYQAFQKQLADMAALDPKTSLRPPPPLDPKPVLKPDGKETNTAVFMFEQLTDVRLGLPGKELKNDLKLSQWTLTQLRVGTAPDEHLTGKARVNEKQELTDGLASRYIGAVKVTSHKPGVAVGTDGFKGGSMEGVVMLFDRQTTKLVYADSFNAKNDAEFTVTEFKDKKIDEKGLQAWVETNLHKNFKKAVLEKFAAGTGGVFEASAYSF